MSRVFGSRLFAPVRIANSTVFHPRLQQYCLRPAALRSVVPIRCRTLSTLAGSLSTPPRAKKPKRTTGATKPAAAGAKEVEEEEDLETIEVTNLTPDSAAAAAGDDPVEVPPAADEKWYGASGLKFGCTACGKCCTSKGGIVRVNEQEILALAAAKGMTYQEFGRRYLVWNKAESRFHLRERSSSDARTDGACILLDGKLCSVYSARPTQCRTFPFWPRYLESKEAWDELGRARCEGVNHPTVGETFDESHIYSYSQIQTIHDSGENYTFHEMEDVLKEMIAAERAEREQLFAQHAARMAAHNAHGDDLQAALTPAAMAAAQPAIEIQTEPAAASTAAASSGVVMDDKWLAAEASRLAKLEAEFQKQLNSGTAPNTKS